jgi:XRE family transcriptional regulator
MLEIYKRIRARREELGISQEELAKRMGYKSRSSINKIEKGENDIPQSKIVAFAQALRTTPAALMGWEQSPASDDLPDLTPKDEREIMHLMDDMKEKLMREEGLMFDGHPASPESIQSILDAMQIGMEMAKKRNKAKYTPKKYRHED